MVAAMATALDKIAHIILPNVMKLKGASTIVGAMERRDGSPFAHVWQQTGIDHSPQLVAKELDGNRFGIMTLPKPSEAGEAHMVAFVAKKNDAGLPRFFTCEYDFILAKTGKTLLCEVVVKDSDKTTVKLGEGPTLSGDFQTDATAFVDALMPHVK